MLCEPLRPNPPIICRLKAGDSLVAIEGAFARSRPVIRNFVGRGGECLGSPHLIRNNYRHLIRRSSDSPPTKRPISPCAMGRFKFN